MKSTKLPIAVWLGMLPEPIRDKAIINHLLYPYFKSNFQVESMHEAIIRGFIWNKTDEGTIFWIRYHQELISQNL